MKYIIAVIQPDRLDEVLKNLEEKEIHLVTVSNVKRHGLRRPYAQISGRAPARCRNGFVAGTLYGTPWAPG